MSKEKDLRELFHDTLKDIYLAEKKILSALPKMAKAAQSDQLRAAFKNTNKKPRAMSNGSKRSSGNSARPHAARPATRLSGSSRRARK